MRGKKTKKRIGMTNVRLHVVFLVALLVLVVSLQDVYATSHCSTRTYYSTTSWTVPQGLTAVQVSGVAGGGGGGGGAIIALGGGGGGGSGASVQNGVISVTPSSTLSIQIGGGGGSGEWGTCDNGGYGRSGGTGGATAISASGVYLLLLNGGRGGAGATFSLQCDEYGCWYVEDVPTPGGAGGAVGAGPGNAGNTGANGGTGWAYGGNGAGSPFGGGGSGGPPSPSGPGGYYAMGGGGGTGAGGGGGGPDEACQAGPGGGGGSGFLSITPYSWLPETTCNDGVDNDCDGATDCADANCAGQLGPGGVRCCQSVADCIQQECGIESCSSNVCSATSRPLCDGTECSAGKYCETSSGLCKAPDESSDVCLSCASDQTSGLAWTSTNHQDAGKGYSSLLFDSNGAACGSNQAACFDQNNNAINHKSSLPSGDCCGDDANEYYKPDYYGAECTSSVDDCVVSSGDALASNTGNISMWCYLHEWSNCTDASIGAKFGGVTCAGIGGARNWTVNSLVKPESQYSCVDALDNDGDGAVDCGDADCDGSIAGVVKDAQGNGVFDVTVKVLQGTSVLKTTSTDGQGQYSLTVRCSLPGTFNIMAEHIDYATVTKTGVVVNPTAQTTINFSGESAVAKADTCEADCTFPGSSVIHASCDGKNGCTFYNPQAAAACDNAQSGWQRDYSATQYVICPNGAPQAKSFEKANVECSSGTLAKTTSTVLYNGKPVKMVVVSCG